MLCVDKLKVILRAAREGAKVPQEGFENQEGGEGSDVALTSPVTVATQTTTKSKQKQRRRIKDADRRKIPQKKGVAVVSTAKSTSGGSTTGTAKRLSDQFNEINKDDDGVLVTKVRAHQLSLFAMCAYVTDVQEVTAEIMTSGFTPSRVPPQRRTPPSDKCELTCLCSVRLMHARICAAATRVTSSADKIRNNSGSSSEELVPVQKKKACGNDKTEKEKLTSSKSNKGNGTPKAKKAKYTGDIEVHLTQGTC